MQSQELKYVTIDTLKKYLYTLTAMLLLGGIK